MANSIKKYWRYDKVMVEEVIKEVEDVSGTLIKFKGEAIHSLIDQIEIQGVKISEHWFDSFGFLYSRVVEDLKLSVPCVKVEFWGRGTNHGKVFGITNGSSGGYIPFTKIENIERQPICNTAFNEIFFVHELQQWWRNNADGELIVK